MAKSKANSKTHLFSLLLQQTGSESTSIIQPPYTRGDNVVIILQKLNIYEKHPKKSIESNKTKATHFVSLRYVVCSRTLQITADVLQCQEVQVHARVHARSRDHARQVKCRCMSFVSKISNGSFLLQCFEQKEIGRSCFIFN